MTAKSSLFFTLMAILCVVGCASDGINTGTEKEVLIFGASGRIGGYLVEEGILRGYDVTGVSRNMEKLATKFPGINAVSGDILDRERLRQLLTQHDRVLVSVGGAPKSDRGEDYIAYTAAVSLIEVLEQLGEDGPVVIFVGNLFTLLDQNGELLLERATEHKNLGMFAGHQLALEAFRASKGIRWTIVSPPSGFRLKGRTGKVRIGFDQLLLDEEGKPASISLEDYAFTVYEELELGRHTNKRITVAR